MRQDATRIMRLLIGKSTNFENTDNFPWIKNRITSRIKCCLFFFKSSWDSDFNECGRSAAEFTVILSSFCLLQIFCFTGNKWDYSASRNMKIKYAIIFSCFYHEIYRKYNVIHIILANTREININFPFHSESHFGAETLPLKKE